MISLQNKNRMESLPHGCFGWANAHRYHIIPQNALFFNATARYSHYTIKFRHNFRLCRWKHVCIAISNVNTLVSHTISDSYSRKAHINQQTDVAMPDSVDSYSFYSAGGATTANFVVEVRFRKREYTVVFIEL